MIIEMQNVCWRREKTYILQDINWEVKPRENWVIMGLNGSGKTTLLNIVNGYIYPSSGEVTILGKRFGKYSLQELRKKIGWVSSSLQENLYVNETVLEIVLSGKFATIGLVDTPEQEDIDKAQELLEYLGCPEFINRPYRSLSQGEKQKVIIARALINSPQVLILDEPCTGLDIIAKEQLLATIEKLSEGENAPTLIYVTHRAEEILPIFGNILMLRKGRVFSAGKTQKVLTSATLTNFFEAPVEVQWIQGRVNMRLISKNEMGFAL
ncbi:MAG: molybdenum ABC transporter ATP-binding protein [Peptococcaceae bacterium BICA1-8]|nr:MAG: molybdenum ABC transporter ATP-binding protein [Peptococcaceae bacterium BICA1-8]